MPRWSIFLLLPLAACAGTAELEADAAQAAMAAHRSSIAALGMPAPATSAPPRPGGTPSGDAGWQLLGASPEALRAALGEPLLRRAEGPAQIWLYAGGGCQVDIVLYAGEAGPRVAHVQARAGGLAQRTEASCLRDISAQATRPRGVTPLPPGPSSPSEGTEFDV